MNALMPSMIQSPPGSLRALTRTFVAGFGLSHRDRQQALAGDVALGDLPVDVGAVEVEQGVGDVLHQDRDGEVRVDPCDLLHAHGLLDTAEVGAADRLRRADADQPGGRAGPEEVAREGPFPVRLLPARLRLGGGEAAAHVAEDGFLDAVARDWTRGAGHRRGSWSAVSVEVGADPGCSTARMRSATPGRA